MKTKIMGALCIATAMCSPAVASPKAPSINYGYSVSGDDQARPVQAFDDGNALYIQLRNPVSPPSPIGETGPIAYKLRGYYMVVPIQRHVRLQYQSYRADITASGFVSDDVVSLTSPVDAYAVTASNASRAAPDVGFQAVSTQQSVHQPSADAVSGDIAVGFGAAASVPSRSAAPVAVVEELADKHAQLTYAEAAMSSSYDATKGKAVSLYADGTVAGAQGVRRAAGVCERFAASCNVNYSGGPAGALLMKVEVN